MKTSSAQNLVPNPGFEICDQCDNRGSVEFGFGLRGTNNPPDWRAATQGSSDIRSEEPRTGRRHGGFFAGTKHEYLLNHLSNPLQTLHTYELNYYLKAASNASYTVDEIGLALTFDDISSNIFTALSNTTPSWTTPDNQFLSQDTFLRINHTHLACGGEQYITFGRFNELTSGDTLYLGQGPRGSVAAYMILDDVSVEEVSPFDFFDIDTLRYCGDTTFRTTTNIAPETFDIWVNGQQGLPQVVVTGSGTYTFEVVCKESGWRYSDTLIVVEEEIMVDLGMDTTLCIGDTLTLAPQQLGETWTYQWSTGDTLSSLLINGPGTYSLTVSDGCNAASDQIQIDLPSGASPPSEWVPNAFTPNGDGRNDVFQFIDEKIDGVTILNVRVKIYNRWGNLIFQEENDQLKWDGGQEVSEVYLYAIECEYISCQDGVQNVTLQGDLTLIR